MKFSEIKDLNKNDLTERITQHSDKLFELKMKHSLGQAQSPIEIRNLRRNIARLKTAVSLKEVSQ